MKEEAPTVFVVPPHPSLECVLHDGVLVDPVETPCGCTFCRSCILDVLECPTHGTPVVPDHLRPNEHVQGFINELLIHCRGGLQRTTSGEWIPNPNGCKLWLSLGRRKEHEDKCTHVTKMGYTPVTPVVRPCMYREQGCLYIGSTEQDVLVHGDLCGYGRLLKHIEQLQSQITQRDLEIERLNNLLTTQQKVSPQANVNNVQQVLDSIKSGLEKLDEDSTRLFEDAKDTLKKTKSNIVNSTAYQTSLQVLHSIKLPYREVVESARSEFVAKIAELESMAKHKVRILTQNGSTGNHNGNITYIEYDKEAPTTTTTTTTSTPFEPLPTTTEASTTNIEDEANVDSQYRNATVATIPAASDVSTPAVVPPSDVAAPAPASPVSEAEPDEDIKEFLEVSKQEYLKEQEARMLEEESIRQAMRLSLLDFAYQQNNK